MSFALFGVASEVWSLSGQGQQMWSSVADSVEVSGSVLFKSNYYNSDKNYCNEVRKIQL